MIIDLLCPRLLPPPRAFFRRAAVALRKKNAHYTSIACKASGACPVTPDIEKKCRRCRYEKCLAAGMRPEQVRELD